MRVVIAPVLWKRIMEDPMCEKFSIACPQRSLQSRIDTEHDLQSKTKLGEAALSVRRRDYVTSLNRVARRETKLAFFGQIRDQRNIDRSARELRHEARPTNPVRKKPTMVPSTSRKPLPSRFRHRMKNPPANVKGGRNSPKTSDR